MPENPKLKLSIHRVSGNTEFPIPLSYQYEIKVGDWLLRECVSEINLKMVANKRPELTIICHPDKIDIDSETFAKLKDRWRDADTSKFSEAISKEIDSMFADLIKPKNQT